MSSHAAASAICRGYAVRYGVEGTINEFGHGHGMRHCRYRGQPKTHLQHVLTAIAVNIERLSGLPPTEETPLTTATDRLPDLPGPARHSPVEVLADAGQFTSTAPRSPTESS
ncbi:transposase [Streptomyces sp. NPDC006602]|uniref:transposase n=1 Tax=Streptomyces sp. NPDC006602 TaxID=3364751 RepID=UPI0036888FF1